MMKRFLLGLSILLLPAVAHAQVTNPLTKVFIIGTAGNCATTACSSGTRIMCRNSTTDTTAYACNTSTGFYVAVASSTFTTSITVPAGSSIGFEGAGGDTYIIWNPDTACIEIYRNAVLDWQYCASKAIPPDCSTSNPAPEFGAMCKNQDTGEVWLRTATGLIALTGAAR